MKSIGISEFKAGCIQLLKEAQRSRTPLIVTLRGRPIARIEPVSGDGPRRLGTLRHLGAVRTDLVAADFSGEWETEEA